MRFQPFDSSFFDQPAVFTLANPVIGSHAGTTEGLAYTIMLNAFVEPDTTDAHRTDRQDGRGGHGKPISDKRWRVITATNPGAQLADLGLDDTVTALGMTLKIAKAPYDGSQGSGVLWVTECKQVE
ncbi:MAG: hypothetical protein P4L84_11130 [Isosphaeraceae bacterium]|nr:hypothetical protein [Isosphaeraceae bacterium]